MRTHSELFEQFKIGINIGKKRNLSFIQMAKEKIVKPFVYEKKNDVKYLHEILQEDLRGMK